MPIQSTKASIELTKNDEGVWLNVEIGGRKATLSLNNSGHSPMVGNILAEWGESHFRPSGPMKRTLALLGECLLTGAVTLTLVCVIGFAIYLCYANAGMMAQGFGLAVGAGLLGAVARYFKITRRAIFHLSGGRLFR